MIEGAVEGGENFKVNENFSEVDEENGGRAFTCNMCGDNFGKVKVE